jgi:hypothetical protein
MAVYGVIHPLPWPGKRHCKRTFNVAPSSPHPEGAVVGCNIRVAATWENGVRVFNNCRR